jgi:hypothetical protein
MGRGWFKGKVDPVISVGLAASTHIHKRLRRGHFRSRFAEYREAALSVCNSVPQVRGRVARIENARNDLFFCYEMRTGVLNSFRLADFIGFEFVRA